MSNLASGEAVQLLEVVFKGSPERGSDAFPFDIPALRTLERLDLAAPLTFFVGENGTGKSTLLEAMALAAKLPVVGSERLEADVSLREQARLAKRLRLVWKTRTHRGFFLRAEDFFGFTKRLQVMRREMEGRLARIDEEYAGRSDLARTLAAGPTRSSLAELEKRYGADLDAHSHGESFLELFRARFIPGGLYLLDEPEAPLSPQSQLALIAMLNDMVKEGGQFVVVTHSPILLAIPGARIFSFDRRPVSRVSFEELEAVELVRDFLNQPERFLRHLWG